jgi:hypothetical protein
LPSCLPSSLVHGLMGWWRPAKVLLWRGDAYMTIFFLCNKRPDFYTNKSSRVFSWSWTFLRPLTPFLGLFFWRFFRGGALDLLGGTWSVACWARLLRGCFLITGCPGRLFTTGDVSGKVTHCPLCCLFWLWMSWIAWWSKLVMKVFYNPSLCGVYIITSPSMLMMWFSSFAQLPQIYYWLMTCYSCLDLRWGSKLIYRKVVSLLSSVQKRTWLWWRPIFLVKFSIFLVNTLSSFTQET